MGTLRGDNGGERPPEGGGLPDLPPEWGTIVVPDDAAALDHEAALVRKEMRRDARRDRWRRRFGLPPGARSCADDDTPALGLPLLIMSIAIIATLTSLFAIAWPSRTAQPANLPRTSGPTAAASAVTVPDLTLRVTGGTLRLHEALPAVLLLIDGCPCADLIEATAQAVGPQVTVIAVGRAIPALPSPVPAGRQVRAASDEQGTLRSTFGGPSPQAAGPTAVLVKSTGEVVTAVAGVHDVDSFRAYLSQLS